MFIIHPNDDEIVFFHGTKISGITVTINNLLIGTTCYPILYKDETLFTFTTGPFLVMSDVTMILHCDPEVVVSRKRGLKPTMQPSCNVKLPLIQARKFKGGSLFFVKNVLVPACEGGCGKHHTVWIPRWDCNCEWGRSERWGCDPENIWPALVAESIALGVFNGPSLSICAIDERTINFGHELVFTALLQSLECDVCERPENPTIVDLFRIMREHVNNHAQFWFKFPPKMVNQVNF